MSCVALAAKRFNHKNEHSGNREWCNSMVHSFPNNSTVLQTLEHKDDKYFGRTANAMTKIIINSNSIITAVFSRQIHNKILKINSIISMFIVYCLHRVVDKTIDYFELLRY